MTASLLACALLVGAMLLTDRTAARRRLRRLGTFGGPARPGRRDRPGRSGGLGRPMASRRLAMPALASVPPLAPALLAGTVVGLMLMFRGPAAGWLLPALAFFLALAWLRRRRPAKSGRRADAVATQSPEIAELLATCLSVGVGPVEAIETVASSVVGEHAARLTRVAGALRLGADQAEAWAGLVADDPLAPVARAFSRAVRSGAPLATTVALVAEEQRRQRRWSAEAAARRAGVLAVGPLVTCFLPAFVLIGIAPVVLSMAGEVMGRLR